MERRLCVISRDDVWASQLRAHMAPRWQVLCIEHTGDLHWIRGLAAQCILVQARDSADQQWALQLPAELWQQQVALPVVVLVAGLQLPAGSWYVECRAATLVSLDLPWEVLEQQVERSIGRWQPLRELAEGIWRFEQRMGRLSPRERLVLERLTEGCWIKRIAHDFGTSPHTVRNQRASILQKLQVQSEHELLRLSLNVRWLQALAIVRGLEDV